MENLIINWSITGIRNLARLVNRFAGAAAREADVFSWAEFDHRNEWLRAWRERVTNKSEIHEYWWINVFIHGVFELGFLD